MIDPRQQWQEMLPLGLGQTAPGTLNISDQIVLLLRRRTDMCVCEDSLCWCQRSLRESTCCRTPSVFPVSIQCQLGDAPSSLLILFLYRKICVAGCGKQRVFACDECAVFASWAFSRAHVGNFYRKKCWHQHWQVRAHCDT